MISIVYITNRADHKFRWFADSLKAQHANSGIEIEVIVVDLRLTPHRKIYYESLLDCKPVKPLPSAVQGEYRVTQEDYFSAANARNTGIAHAKGDYIMYVDDLSVLMPTWLEAVSNARNTGAVLEGAYRKDRRMEVANGILVSSEQTPDGQDSRWNLAKGKRGHDSWLYGCSVGMPIAMALEVNGWDTMTDMIGYEDCNMGIRLAKAGASFVYDKAALTIESQEHHFTEGNVLKRFDMETSPERYFEVLREYGADGTSFHHITRYDCSHALIDIAKRGAIRPKHNRFSVEDLRNIVKDGREITVGDMQFHDTFWFDGNKLTEW